MASGSSGNCTFLATHRTRILVDAGLSVKEIARRLALIDETLDNLDGILVTHEHSDHVSSLGPLARKTKAPVYATRLTAPRIEWNDATPPIEHFQAGCRISIGDIEIDSFSIPHDAIDPVGFCFHTQGIKIGLATDLGYVTDSLRVHLRGTHLLVLESNHDLDMLKVGPYPWSVKQRVMSRMGHLSNDTCSDFLIHDLDGATAHLILGHLSEHNNHPAIVQMVVTQALEQRDAIIPFEIASQKQPTAVYHF